MYSSIRLPAITRCSTRRTGSCGHPSAQYFVSNFGSGLTSTLARENYQTLAFLDTSARAVATQGYDPVTKLDVDISSSLVGRFSKLDKLIALPLSGVPVTGIVLLEEGPMLVSARPILTSESKGPVGGVLLMGCYLGATRSGSIGAKNPLESLGWPA